MRSGSFSERMSIGNYRIEFFGPVDHALHFGFGGDSVAKIFGIVDLDELSVKIGSYAMSKLLDSIHSGSLEQFGKLSGDALDTEQVGMVSPFEDESLRDAAFFGEFFASFGSSGAFQQFFGRSHPKSFELPSIYFTDTFDLINFVSHHIRMLVLARE